MSTPPEPTALPAAEPWKMSYEDARRVALDANLTPTETRHAVSDAVAAGVVPDPRQHGEGKCRPDRVAQFARDVCSDDPAVRKAALDKLRSEAAALGRTAELDAVFASCKHGRTACIECGLVGDATTGIRIEPAPVTEESAAKAAFELLCLQHRGRADDCGQLARAGLRLIKERAASSCAEAPADGEALAKAGEATLVERVAETLLFFAGENVHEDGLRIPADDIQWTDTLNHRRKRRATYRSLLLGVGRAECADPDCCGCYDPLAKLRDADPEAYAALQARTAAPGDTEYRCTVYCGGPPHCPKCPMYQAGEAARASSSEDASGQPECVCYRSPDARFVCKADHGSAAPPPDEVRERLAQAMYEAERRERTANTRTLLVARWGALEDRFRQPYRDRASYVHDVLLRDFTVIPKGAADEAAQPQNVAENSEGAALQVRAAAPGPGSAVVAILDDAAARCVRDGVEPTNEAVIEHVSADQMTCCIHAVLAARAAAPAPLSSEDASGQPDVDAAFPSPHAETEQYARWALEWMRTTWSDDVLRAALKADDKSTASECFRAANAIGALSALLGFYLGARECEMCGETKATKPVCATCCFRNEDVSPDEVRERLTATVQRELYARDVTEYMMTNAILREFTVTPKGEGM